MKITTHTTQLNQEETFLWDLARYWRDPSVRLAAPDDWSRLVALAIDNKMTVLLDGYLVQRGLRDQLPIGAADQLEKGVSVSAEKAQSLTSVLRDYMPLARQAGVPTIPLKGLWVSERIYGNPQMRPGHDLDLLVPHDKIKACIAVCEGMEFNRYWPGLLPDAYYVRHHLHLELSLPDCWTWVEIHWAFDHPRTLLTIDYEQVFSRATQGELLGVQIWEPNWVDVLLSLAVHLVKHANYLPLVLEHPQLERILLADGRLMHCLDVAEAIKRYEGQIDWALLIKVAQESGAVGILGAVLRMCVRLFAAPVPATVLAALPLPVLPWYEQRAYVAMADHMLAKAEGRQTQGIWAWLVEPNWTLIFRPIRLLDYVTYLFPSADFLQRKYGGATLVQRVKHGVIVLGTYVQLVWDTLYSTLQVKRKPLMPDVVLPADSKCRE